MNWDDVAVDLWEAFWDGMRSVFNPQPRPGKRKTDYPKRHIDDATSMRADARALREDWKRTGGYWRGRE